MVKSLAKLMTAYVVLGDHPLSATASGSDVTVTATDAAVYQNDLASGDSVVAAEGGEHLSERQALEALLVPSGGQLRHPPRRLTGVTELVGTFGRSETRPPWSQRWRGPAKPEKRRHTVA